MKGVNNIKKSQLIHFIIIYLLLVLLYRIESSSIKIMLTLIMILLSFKDKYIPFILLGASNYLPTVCGISQVIISILNMTILLIFKLIDTRKKIKFPFSYKETLLLLLMVIWSLTTGIMNSDMSFFSSIITAFILWSITIIYYNYYELNNIKVLKYCMIGLSVGIFLMILIKLNISGFVSNHIFRLAIGNRADPNSTALLFCILSVYLFISFFTRLEKGDIKCILILIAFVFSTITLFLTQSRGSLLCFGITIIIYLINKIDLRKKVNTKAILNAMLIIVILTAILAFFPKIRDSLIEPFNSFVERINDAESSDGERLYLIKKSWYSFKSNPIIGISLNTFKENYGHIPHNTFCDYLVTNGVIGAIFFILFFIVPLLKNYFLQKTENNKIEYFCYFACCINVLFYSASNEKIIYILLIVLLFSKKNKIYSKEK